jgi:predicted nucleotidyltransferase
MTPHDYKIARELKKRLAEAVELLDFKVYGSRARGDDDEFSDLDVFIMDKRFSKSLHRMFNARQVADYKELVEVSPNPIGPIYPIDFLPLRLYGQRRAPEGLRYRCGRSTDRQSAGWGFERNSGRA